MIDKSVVKQLVEDWLSERDYFLTDLSVSADDRIVVEIDHPDGVWIEDCVELSRHIEQGLNRDEEDYELEVGSAGIGQPFKVLRQYQMHQGDQVETLTLSGEKLQGTLGDVGQEDFTLTYTVRERAEGEKRPRPVERQRRLRYDEVKWTKYVIDFR